MNSPIDNEYIKHLSLTNLNVNCIPKIISILSFTFYKNEK